MSKPVFYDPQQKRWGRLRRLLNVLGVVITGLTLFFLVTVIFESEKLPPLQFPGPKHTLRALKEKDRAAKKKTKSAHRKTKATPSQVVLNTDEGIRAAYYVSWDAASFVSLKEYCSQIDLLFPEWLHVLTPDGSLQGADESNHLFPVVHGVTVTPPDNKVMPFLKSEKANVDVFPLINNFDPERRQWLKSVGQFLQDPAARGRFRNQLLLFLGSDHFKGATIDFEEIPSQAQPGFLALIVELGQDLHARGLKLYVNVPVGDDDFDFRTLAAAADGLILMNYDEHHSGSAPGAVASQSWFTANLQRALKAVEKTKLICAIGNYGYDWATSSKSKGVITVDDNTVQEAWLHARESGAGIDFDPNSLNPHFAYEEDDGTRHHVWYLDGVTALNQMRAARDLGIRTFALWRLGSEDRSLWAVWDNPLDAGAPQKLNSVPPGQDVDREGDGEILSIERGPSAGERHTTLDSDGKLVISEKMDTLPQPYQLLQYGAQPGKVAITFDDGPDPEFTPRILDILREKNVKATFFLIGAQAQKFPGIAQRIYAEGNAIGNHTFTHPDISDVSAPYLKLELNVTEWLFASKLGIKPLYFRPPYSIDEEPDVSEQVRPLELVQAMGYITVGSKIDPHDWEKGRTPEEIATSVLEQAQSAATTGCDERPPLYCGNVILLHDGGGDRESTIRALPAIIDGLRQRGLQIVPVEELIGKERNQVMLPLASGEIWSARLNDASFTLLSWVQGFVVLVFFVGDVLMSLRLLGIGALAVTDRVRTGTPPSAPDFNPQVTVIVPAYNEEKVIEHTVRSVLASDYPHLRAIVVDDGSPDGTVEVVRTKFQSEIAEGRVLLLTKANGGKASALNYALQHTDDEIYVGIDADTVIDPRAVSLLVAHFADASVGAVSGNAKVGNRVNLWTRWQALEYITSQNFERRALNVFGAVSVVPGAIGAWRMAAVRQAGGYPTDTVAEDADLTMSLLEKGWRVVNEDRALAYTEAPTTANGLMRQRFRWSFGILQAVWKNGRAMGKRSRLGWIALPNIVIFQILLPLVAPFMDIIALAYSLAYVVGKYFHPESNDSRDFQKMAFFFVVFLVIDFAASALAFLLERREPADGQREEMQLLLHLWLQRFAYRQLFSAVLLKTVKRAIDGKPFAWDKLERTADVARISSVGAGKS
jgi:cellulose synthase/poly-beta-1,6-N-acetylglucosamine synthase-like glycosyltransferase/peptidoglycan/xylan/chitin deacetylase (PgdA/CDA1 family)/spore germination protein YaaH